MDIVKFEHVSKIYGSGETSFKALDEIDLTLEQGKFIVVLGPSGAGKSTLLNLLGGLDVPTSGKIIVDGKDISTLKVLGFKDKKIGNLLITQNMWISVLGTIIGIPLGIWTLDYLIHALASEYEMSLSINFLSYVISILIILGVSWLVSVVVANKNKKIDMVESLKCAE